MNSKIKVAVAMGSNLGDREKNIRLAAQNLQGKLLENSTLSSLIETAPWGFLEQPNFLNAVIVGFSDRTPPEILSCLKTIEREMGRVLTFRNGPRVIDLDLICYGLEISESEGVVVPHPRMSERDFVLSPLLEVWPEWTHPILRKDVRNLLADLKNKS